MDGISSQQVVFRLPLRDDSDVAQSRLRIRELCASHGLALNTVEALTTAASEIARNVIVHAGEGEMSIGTVREGKRTGIVVVAHDNGLGIPNIEDALRDGYSTGDGLGLGLPSARRLVHDFDIQSVVGEGTQVTLVMWSK